MNVARLLAVASLCVASFANAGYEKPAGALELAQAPAVKKDGCTKGKRCDDKSSKAENRDEKRVSDELKGTSEKTKLPDTARYDARGGVFI